MKYNLLQRQKQSKTISGSGNPHWKGGKVTKYCVRCGSPFQVYPSGLHHTHCSLLCSNRDMADAQKGVINPKKIHYGKDNYFYGKHWTGSKSGFWKGGVSPLNHLIRCSTYTKEWRISIFKRDNYTCQNCGKHSGDLHAHHIKPFALFPELRFAIDNGKTLCVECHRKTFKKIIILINQGGEMGIKLSGKNGYVQVATSSVVSVVLGIKDWSIDYTIDPLETTDFSASGAATYLTGVSRWSGAFSGYKDGVPQTLGVDSVSIMLTVTSASTTGWSGIAYITGIHSTNAADGVAGMNYDFQGNGTFLPPTT